MAVTQYIGARYVPLIFTNPDDNSNNWKAGIVYDPLTIVMDLNQSYTSKIPVPATVGRPSENPEYWVLTGSYNAQVSGLSTQVTQLDADVQALSEHVEELDASTVKKVSNRQYLFVSDSYGVTGNSWPYKFAEIADLPADRWHNLAVSGTGFWVNNTNGFLNQITSYTGDRSVITDIIVAGGLNDSVYALNQTSGLVSAITAFCDYAKSEYPNATVYIAYIGAAKDNSDLIAGRTINNRLIAKYIYRSVALDNGVRFLDGCERSLIGNVDFLDSDGVHPSASGYLSIAKNIFASLSGSTNESYPQYPFNFTATAPFSLGTLYDSRWSIDGNNALLEIPDQVTLPVTSGQSLAPGWREVASFNTIFFDRELNVPCVLQLSNFNSQPFNIIKSQIKFSANKMFIRLTETNDTHSQLITYVAGSGASVSIYTNSYMFDPLLFIA